MMRCDIISFPANIYMASSMPTFGRYDYYHHYELVWAPYTQYTGHMVC